MIRGPHDICVDTGTKADGRRERSQCTDLHAKRAVLCCALSDCARGVLADVPLTGHARERLYAALIYRERHARSGRLNQRRATGKQMSVTFNCRWALTRAV